MKINKSGRWELYDLGKDISETTDISQKHPDIMKKVKKYAEKAHAPVKTGEVFDRDLVEKDRAQEKFKPGRLLLKYKKKKKKSKK